MINSILNQITYKREEAFHMKKRLAAIVILAALVFSGCSDMLVKEPKELMKPPRLSRGQEKIRKFISNTIPEECVLSAPLEMKKLAAINFVDINADGTDEIIAFYKYREHPRYGMIVIGQDGGNLKKITDIEAPGDGIDYVSFIDMDYDGLSEIQIGWAAHTNEEDYRELYIYRFNNARLEKVFSGEYDELAIDNLDDDRAFEIVLLNLQGKYSEEGAYAQLFKYRDQLVEKTDELQLESNGYMTAFYSVKPGRLSEGKNGVFIDFKYSSESFATEVLIVENSMLERVFKRQTHREYAQFDEIYEKTYKTYEIDSSDIDGDGVIEIGKPIRPLGHEDSPKLSIPWIWGWYKWDGDGGLRLSRESFLNSSEGYELLFPERWNENMTVKRSGFGEKPGWVTISYVGKNAQKVIPLYTIFTIDSELEYNKNNYKDLNRFIEIKGKTGMKYILRNDYKDNKITEMADEEYRNMIMTRDEIFDNFKILR